MYGRKLSTIMGNGGADAVRIWSEQDEAGGGAGRIAGKPRSPARRRRLRGRRSAGVLQAGGHSVDGQEQQPFQALALRISVAQRGERAQLQVRERVDVRI